MRIAPQPAAAFPFRCMPRPVAVHQDVFYTVPRAGHLVGGTRAPHPARALPRPRADPLSERAGLRARRRGGRIRSSAAISSGSTATIRTSTAPEVRSVGGAIGCASKVRNSSGCVVSCQFRPARCSAAFMRPRPFPSFARFSDSSRQRAGGRPAHPRRGRPPDCPRLLRPPESRGHRPDLPPSLGKAVERMKLFYFERHNVAGLAALSGMSDRTSPESSRPPSARARSTGSAANASTRRSAASWRPRTRSRKSPSRSATRPVLFQQGLQATHRADAAGVPSARAGAGVSLTPALNLVLAKARLGGSPPKARRSIRRMAGVVPACAWM